MPDAAATAQGAACVARGRLRRLVAGADRRQDPLRVVLRLRIGILLGALRVADPQRVACSRVAETRDPG